MCKAGKHEYAIVTVGAWGGVSGYTGPGTELPYNSLNQMGDGGWEFVAVLTPGSTELNPSLLFKRHKPAYTPGGVEIVSVRELLDEPQNRQAAG